MLSDGFNIDSFDLYVHQQYAHPTASPSSVEGETLSPAVVEQDETPAPVIPGDAYGGVPAVIPGVIEAEEFDTGGEGVGYSDVDVGNNGGVSPGRNGRVCSTNWVAVMLSDSIIFCVCVVSLECRK